uniref:Uncharacterized protein n=1 Tax=Arundo donax TaxID=35708 RepID=A0A0A9BCP4_ARUDO
MVLLLRLEEKTIGGMCVSFQRGVHYCTISSRDLEIYEVPCVACSLWKHFNLFFKKRISHQVFMF